MVDRLEAGEMPDDAPGADGEFGGGDAMGTDSLD
jgi:hypothetical protein